MLRRLETSLLFALLLSLHVGAGCGGDSSVPTTEGAGGSGAAGDGGTAGTTAAGAGGAAAGGPAGGSAGGGGATAGASSTGGQAGSAGAVSPWSGAVEIIVEPGDDAAAVVAAIQGAKTSVHVTMYLLSSTKAISALIAAKKAGRDVKVVLNQSFPPGGPDNAAEYQQLKSAGVPVVWAPSTFTLTHEKCVIVDGTTAFIMTMNLTETSPSQNREYLAVDTDPADVAEAEAIFTADFAGTAVDPAVLDGKLVVAPTNAQAKILALLATATSTIDVEAEELSDTKVVDALLAKSKAGVKVRVVLPSGTLTTAQENAATTLKAAGIPVVTLSKPYVHAKAVVVDGVRAYVGSINFTFASVSKNRELGVITDAPAAVAKVASTIGVDFAAGVPK